MKVRMAIAACMVAGIAWGSERECVAVHLVSSQLVTLTAITQAKYTASELFREIGVELRWVKVDPDCLKVEILFEPDTPFESHPGALAYATPFGGSGAQIHVLMSRLVAISSPEQRGVSLGYVLAHEIGHVLERLTRHSDEGVMKACWNTADFARMPGRRLRFAPEDAELIHYGFLARSVRGTPVGLIASATR